MARKNECVKALKGQNKLFLYVNDEFYSDLKREALDLGVNLTDVVLSHAEAGRNAKAHLKALYDAAKLIVTACDVTTDDEARYNLVTLSAKVLEAIEGVMKYQLEANPALIRQRAKAEQAEKVEGQPVEAEAQPDPQPAHAEQQ
ncbi:hypothetical protein FX016_21780 [Cupriavidus gilardii]|nr:hypothetical protein FX016_21780 [Cupriavidus gilardii]